MVRMLITGGAGFIGSNFVRHIAGRYPDYEIAVLDSLTYAGNTNNLKDLMDRIRFIKGDIRDEAIVDSAVKGCDQIVHFAAETHVDRSITDPRPFLTTDVIGTSYLLEAAVKYGIEKFVHISTDEVYGSAHRGSFTETDPLRPSNLYSASKAGAEMLIFPYNNTFGLPVVVTRSSNNYGEYQHPEKFIPRSITNILTGKKIPVYGNGMNVRDWIYARDNCEAIDVVRLKGKNGEAYNLGGECERTNIEVAHMILSFLGKTDDGIEYVPDRPGHDYRYSLSNEKVRKLGWKPTTPFEEGLKRTVEWYVKNEWWWKPLAG